MQDSIQQGDITKSISQDPIKDFYNIQSPRAKDYWLLMKPRVMSLVIFTSFAGIYMAPNKMHPFLIFISILCISIGAGAAGCLNMWLEKESDAKMTRTLSRPTVTGIISSDSALSFGIINSVLSIMMMQVFINSRAAFLLLFTIFFYVIIYTKFLKPNTAQNIVIGGLAGAFPPVIGWACASPLDFKAWSLCLIIFLWTPAHFWALALIHRHDYEKADIPILPNIKGIESTKNNIIVYIVLTIISSLLPYYFKMCGYFYLICVLFFGMGFLYTGIGLKKSKDLQYGLKVFAFSMLYLFMVFASMMIDKKF